MAVLGQYEISDSFEEFHKFLQGVTIDFVLPEVFAEYLCICKTTGSDKLGHASNRWQKKKILF